jgi:hypothetical protein
MAKEKWVVIPEVELSVGRKVKPNMVATLRSEFRRIGIEII